MQGKKLIPDTAEAIANNRRKEINTVDLCEAKRVKMKQLIPQDETSQGNLVQNSSDSSTKFHSNQVPWIWVLNKATRIMNRKGQDISDKLPWKLLYYTPDSIKLRFHVRMGIHKSLMGLLMTGSNRTYRVRGQERA